MTTQHTPGPWVFYDDSNDGKTNRIEIAARGKTVARIYHSVPEEDLPNARLISAAPDLLEAAKTIMKNLDGMAGEVTAGYHESIIAPLRDAIAKATGVA